MLLMLLLLSCGLWIWVCGNDGWNDDGDDGDGVCVCERWGDGRSGLLALLLRGMVLALVDVLDFDMLDIVDGGQ